MIVGRQVQTNAFLWSDDINRYIGVGAKGVITGVNGDKKHVLIKFNTYSFEMEVSPDDLDFVNNNGDSCANC